jgi:hypothetical protein
MPFVCCSLVLSTTGAISESADERLPADAIVPSSSLTPEKKSLSPSKPAWAADRLMGGQKQPRASATPSIAPSIAASILGDELMKPSTGVGATILKESKLKSQLSSNNSAASTSGLPPRAGQGKDKQVAKKSIKKSIRNMFKSKRSKAPPPAASPPAPTGGAVKGTGTMKRKAGAVTVEEYINGNIGDSDGFESLDDRAISAAQWTDKSVKQMIHEITTRGSSNAAGQIEITFGKLFEETADIFDALVGILKTSRKYQVVNYASDGGALWQGTVPRFWSGLDSKLCSQMTPPPTHTHLIGVNPAFSCSYCTASWVILL